ncbi:MAG TPA: Gfo/Idh/MocA family oxidoreductase, partial [Armatimonadota bacterium]|nr:Gfo/Idh/MocA family oxidoreductase [Armatimonadota bacterium]
MGELGFGIIGCGVIAPFHAQGIQAAQNTRLVAVCDIIPAKAEAFAKKYGAERWYTDYKQMLADPEIQIVSICTPSGIHGECTIAAAEAGKNVLCEKPLEIKRERMDAMIAACRKAGVKLGGIFQRRTYSTIQAVRKMIADGRFGRMVLGDAYLKYYRSPEYYKSADWRGTWELDGGGCLMNQGVHGIDEILWLMGPVKSVFARCNHLVRDI